MPAAKVTIKLSLPLLKKLNAIKTENVVNDGFADRIGSMVVSLMKALIAVGQSPVRGFGRFAQYKNPSKYPGGKKNRTPVNLSLTGDMLKELNYRRSGNKIEVGILPDAPNKIKIIARVHNTGERSDIVQRQFIPNDGEEFVISIQSKIKSMFRERVLEIIKARN